MKLCMGCMSLINDQEQKCPVCGYVEGTPPSEAYYLAPGTQIANRYIVGKVLGYGGFGITYIGFDPVLKIPVAIKEFFPSDCVTRGTGTKNVSVFSGNAGVLFDRGLRSFSLEAKRLAQLQEIDGIVRVYDCVHDNDTGYIIMEYLKGRTVKEILKSRKTIP